MYDDGNEFNGHSRRTRHRSCERGVEGGAQSSKGKAATETIIEGKVLRAGGKNGELGQQARGRLRELSFASRSGVLEREREAGHRMGVKLIFEKKCMKNFGNARQWVWSVKTVEVQKIWLSDRHVVHGAK